MNYQAIIDYLDEFAVRGVSIAIHDTPITITKQDNANGSSTYFISNLIMWFTSSKQDVIDMLVKFETQRNWEQEK